MGNGISSSSCFSGCAGRPSRLRRRHVVAAVTSEPLDEGLGHSFCYVSSSKLDEESNNNTNMYSISGASVSANPSTALSTSLDPYSSYSSSAAAFDSSTSFSSVPLRRVGGGDGGGNERGFLSGPIERGFLSGPLDDHRNLFSGPLDGSGGLTDRLRRSLSQSLFRNRNKGSSDDNNSSSGSIGLVAAEDQWAQGKAGEDRVHVVVSEENDSVFVGIYDGFNGPDATDFLLSNLYLSVQKELEAVRSQGQSHLHVLKALSLALRRTEEYYFEVADNMSAENPELALMGSCVLVMLMKGEDVYLMSVGDSRAVLARTARRRQRGGGCGGGGHQTTTTTTTDGLGKNLTALQLTLEHSTGVKEEVLRIRNEHPDDSSAIANDRVKGSLKVTRAFGAGFLKQPKWNNALLEMFRIDYVGTSPYITCNPYLYHHTLGPRDRFLILSSDGLYQYFNNDEAVAEVELFITTTPEGDPAQHLVEQVLFRAAKKAGMDFHELLEIPQGDRRRYHDDVSVIVISLEGRIWRSCV